MGEFQETKPRGPVAAMFGSPGPCYGLPGLVGQEKHDPRSVHYKSPGWSFGTRHGKWGNDSSPGPAYHPNPRYSNKGPDGTPQYSLYSRTTDGHVETTPGPGQYSPEQKPVFAHSNPPAYTFGMRRKGRRTDDTPGNIFCHLTSSKTWTVSIKPRFMVYSYLGHSMTKPTK